MHSFPQVLTTSPQNYSARVDSSGRIVLPAELRERLHFLPGQELVLRADGESLRVKTYEQILTEAQAYCAKLAPPDVVLSEELIRDRRAEEIGRAHV